MGKGASGCAGELTLRRPVRGETEHPDLWVKKTALKRKKNRFSALFFKEFMV